MSDVFITAITETEKILTDRPLGKNRVDPNKYAEIIPHYLMEDLKSNAGKMRDVMLRTQQRRLVKYVRSLCPSEDHETGYG
ncbi:unnamed protein product [Schistocephalus solidus]|uniref:DNA-directed RNA polymerase n=1 Tax=Schistocephalus solidus TaxID=70667 RepID=A0A183SVX3_SCHSO|nr:unnamed protein product [Schistocephalus solidus]